MTLDEAVNRRWTVVGPRPDPDGSSAFIITIAELPGFLAAGETAEDAEEQFLPALRALMTVYLETGRPIPALQNASAPGWASFRIIGASEIDFHACFRQPAAV